MLLFSELFKNQRLLKNKKVLQLCCKVNTISTCKQTLQYWTQLKTCSGSYKKT